MTAAPGTGRSPRRPEGAVTIMLAGDVMTGRGIDQILAHPSDPVLYESYVHSALDYVRLAERASGTIPRQVAPEYVWGDALAMLDGHGTDVRVVNLETAVTRAATPWPKGINYRMHPDNIDALTVARLDCCVLANNHVLDWGSDGLVETLETLAGAGIRTCGAGRNAQAATAPARVPLPGGGRLLVHAVAFSSSGVPSSWRAGTAPGVSLAPEDPLRAARQLAERLGADKQAGDLAVVSAHWGPNWGYEIPPDIRAFAHALIDDGTDVVFGHSSHHPKAIEVYRGKLILYGCGDLINDYEGISGYADYRGDLSLVYLAQLDSGSGRLLALDLLPFRLARFRLNRATDDEAAWLRNRLDRECRRFGGGVAAADAHLRLVLAGAGSRT